MARESDGLKIALSVFVALAMIFAVSTFLFYNRNDATNNKLADSDKNLRETREKADQAGKEAARLREIIADKLFENKQMTDVEKQVSEDMETFWPRGTEDIKDSDRTYRSMLNRLNTELQKKEASLVESDKRVEDLRKQLEDRKKVVEPIIANLEAEKKTAVAEVVTVRSKATADLDAVAERRKTDLAEYQASKQKADKEKSALEASGTAARRVVAEKEKQVTEQRKLIDKLATNASPDRPSGKIDFVSQGEGKVWINLGRADNLNRLVTFSVYSSDTADLGRAQKKAGIEVIDILGEHSSLARIVEDKASDPIVKGDVIHTPVWTPGEQMHVALAGRMELDDSGSDDLDKAITLLKMNGCVIDCWHDQKGETHGDKINAGTRFLVNGKTPDAKSPPEVLKAWNAMQSTATKWQTKVVTLKELLRLMGWKAPTQLVRYGVGANPISTYAQPDKLRKAPEGGSAPSSQFKPRTAPSASAY
jgi:hypothetical protein